MSVIIPSSHEEWLEERKKGLGGSDAAAVLGISNWKTNVQLWEEKTGLRQAEDISEKSYVQYGHDAEPHLRALFALDHPELKVTYESPYKMIFSDTHPFIYATPDGELEEIVTGRKGGLEVKTTEIMSPSQWAKWKGRIPDEYYSQVIHQFVATGWEFIILNAQIKWRTRDGELRKDTREYHIERIEVEEDIAAYIKEAVKTWDSINKKIRPALKLPEI